MLCSPTFLAAAMIASVSTEPSISATGELLVSNFAAAWLCVASSATFARYSFLLADTHPCEHLAILATSLKESPALRSEWMSTSFRLR